MEWQERNLFNSDADIEFLTNEVTRLGVFYIEGYGSKKSSSQISEEVTGVDMCFTFGLFCALPEMM